MHVTALFLGEQSEEGVCRIGADVADRMRDVPKLDLTYRGAGCFGHPPRVLFLRWQSSGGTSFEETVRAVRESAQRSGLHTDPSTLRQDAVAHLTLLRFRGSRESRNLRHVAELQRGDVGWRIAVPDPPDAVRRLVLSSLVLFRSTLKPTGAIYDVLRTFDLGTATNSEENMNGSCLHR